MWYVVQGDGARDIAGARLGSKGLEGQAMELGLDPAGNREPLKNFRERKM